MGRKPARRKAPPPPPPPALPAGWRLLPPAAAHQTEADALETVVAALEAMRAGFVAEHGREPTEAEVVELVSLGLADGLDDDSIDDLLLEDGEDGDDEPAR